MALTAGTRVGSYEVVELIGQGGMGEVYRAVDTRLKRDVALKVLPTSVAAESDRLLRFAREAEMLAALNHPNIASIYGVEESGGVRALVMELVDGETLADHIARGPIPVPEALAIARQIALALESAHEQGIIHRDLKPANIKLRDDGTVKVLDFGLAKLVDPVGPASGGSSLSLSPTITSPALMTNVGMLLGTAAYMSPEQAKGRPADKRSDLWAFGCVLFEMLTGTRAFEAEDVSETLAVVLRGDPPWAALPAETPLAVRTLIRRCLEKDRRKRVADSAAVLFTLDEHPHLIAAAPPPDDTANREVLHAAVEETRRTVEQRARRRLLAAGVSAVLAVIAAAGGTWWAMRPAVPLQSYLAIPASALTAPQIAANGSDVAITSDGTRIVYYTGGPGQTSSLAVHRLDAPAPLPLNIQRAGGHFLSPDDSWIGYYGIDDNSLRKIPILGGPSVPIARDVSGLRGASWAPDDTLVFGTGTPDGLWTVSAAGGKPVPLTTLDPSQPGLNHVWPDVLPGGRAVLFTVVTATGDSGQIALLNLETKQYRVIIQRGTYPRYSPTGHILYAAGGTLFAVGFDLDTLTVTTPTPTPVVDSIVTKDSGAANFDISANGTLVYVRGSGNISQRSIAWVDRTGRPQAVPGLPAAEYRSLRVGPGGLQIVLEDGAEGNGRISTYDVKRATSNTLISGGDARNPMWSPDGKRIVYSSWRDGKPAIFAINADGTGSGDLLATIPDAVELWPHSWSRDGTLLIATATPRTTGDVVAVTPGGKVITLLGETFVETHPAVSPNNEWLAYMVLRDGTPDVFVERYPALGDRRTLSRGGGMLPVWSHDNQELFYFNPVQREMMRVSLKGGTFGTPESLFKLPAFQLFGWRTYDVMPDGRFVMILRPVDGEAASPAAIVAQNWGETLKRLVPVK